MYDLTKPGLKIEKTPECVLALEALGINAQGMEAWTGKSAEERLALPHQAYFRNRIPDPDYYNWAEGLLLDLPGFAGVVPFGYYLQEDGEGRFDVVSGKAVETYVAPAPAADPEPVLPPAPASVPEPTEADDTTPMEASQ